MADDKKRDDYTIEMGDRDKEGRFEPPRPAYTPPAKTSSIMNHPMMPILSYCFSSILMTVLNKFVLSPTFNLNFFLICIQVWSRATEVLERLTAPGCKPFGLITYRDFNSDEAKKCMWSKQAYSAV